MVKGEIIYTIRYADDTVILATNLTDLQYKVEQINPKCGNNGIKINVKKTKAMLITKTLNIRAYPEHKNRNSIMI